MPLSLSSLVQRTVLWATLLGVVALVGVRLPAVFVAGSSGAVEIAVPPAVADDEEVEYGRLIVITNFDVVEVEINNIAYPYEWIWGDSTGVMLPAGYDIPVSVSVSPEQRRTYRINLRAGETRMLVVDIENMGQVAAAPAPTDEGAVPNPQPAAEEGSGEAENVGYLGVSSSPRGTVHVDGASTGQRSPARRIPLEPGRHEVTVYYDEEEVMSEVKHVLIRQGVNTNVFFRLRRDAAPEGTAQ